MWLEIRYKTVFYITMTWRHNCDVHTLDLNAWLRCYAYGYEKWPLMTIIRYYHWQWFWWQLVVDILLICDNDIHEIWWYDRHGSDLWLCMIVILVTLLYGSEREVTLYGCYNDMTMMYVLHNNDLLDSGSTLLYGVTL